MRNPLRTAPMQVVIPGAGIISRGIHVSLLKQKKLTAEEKAAKKAAIAEAKLQQQQQQQQ